MEPAASAEAIDGMFRAMASAMRRQVLTMLADGGASVSALAACLPVTRGAVSQHLKVLLAAGLVAVREQGRERLYQLRAAGMAQLAAHLAPPVTAPLPEPVAQAPAAPPTDAPAEPVAEALAKWQADATHIDYNAVALLLYFDQIGHSVFKSTCDVAASAGMSYKDLMVLGALRRVGAPYESNLTELSGMFWMSLPGMMKRLTRLEALGYLARARNPRDRRSQHVRLTAHGLGTLRALVADRQPTEYFALLNLTAQERATLSVLLPKLLGNIDRLHAYARPAYVVR
jgi:DNA-binding MarR family transcriptional regulator